MEFRIKGLDWDDENDPEGNVQHIAKHGVTPREVSEVLESGPAVFLLEMETEEGSPYYVVVGYTAEGRMLEVYGVLYKAPPVDGFWHTATAMDARRQWRQEYFSFKGGEKMSRIRKETIQMFEEKGETLAAHARPVPDAEVDIDIKSERITVRLSREEVRAMDLACKAYGIGRSTFLRMAARKLLGMAPPTEKDPFDQAAREVTATTA